jgi:hypothetical protein
MLRPQGGPGGEASRLKVAFEVYEAIQRGHGEIKFVRDGFDAEKTRTAFMCYAGDAGGLHVNCQSMKALRQICLGLLAGDFTCAD